MTNSRILHGFHGRNAPVAMHQKGSYIYDDTGKKYLDGSSGPCCVTLDYGNEEVLKVLEEQSSSLSFTYRSQFRNQPAEMLDKMLADLAPDPLNWSVFVNSGSEACDMAIKLARKYWMLKGHPSKYMAISRWVSYHGSTMGALGLTGTTARRKHMTPALNPSPQVNPPYCYRCPYEKTYPACELLCARDLGNVIEKLGAEYVSAFVVEPLTGASGGVITPPPGYYEIVREICDEFEVLLITDEVLTAPGRTGRFFAMEHWDAVPDMVAFGKGVTSGYSPLSGVLCSDEINDVLKSEPALGLTGHTFGGNPLSSAVACKVIDIILRDDLVARAEEKGAKLRKLLEDMAKDSPLIGDVRGKGLLNGIEFVRDKDSRAPYEKSVKVTERVVKACFDNGLMIYPASGGINGVKGDAIYVSPHLTVRDAEIEELVKLLQKSIHQVYQEIQDLE